MPVCVWVGICDDEGSSSGGGGGSDVGGGGGNDDDDDDEDTAHGGNCCRAIRVTVATGSLEEGLASLDVGRCVRGRGEARVSMGGFVGCSVGKRLFGRGICRGTRGCSGVVAERDDGGGGVDNTDS